MNPHGPLAKSRLGRSIAKVSGSDCLPCSGASGNKILSFINPGT